MRSEAVEAGLDACEVRLLYSQFKTSTPPRGRVCAEENVDYWGGEHNNASNIAPYISDISNNCVNVWVSDDPDRREVNSLDIDSKNA